MRQIIISAALALGLCQISPAFGQIPSSANAAAETASQAPIQLPTGVRPEHYDLLIRPDASKLTFTGSLKINVLVSSATSTITLNAADIGFDHVQILGTALSPKIALDADQQTATFKFSHILQPGAYTLAIDYHGKIYQQASGLFALDYDTPHGKRRALFTQFEPADARRFLPVFDEPAQKATFTLSAVTPKGEFAVSNMPVANRAAVSPSLERVTFAQTPQMSSYLLFFGLGDFERIHRKVDGVDIGVIVPRGDAFKAGYTLDAASEILPYYNSYFGRKYPLPKLDYIAGPGISAFFGAMENWGAIFAFEGYLLVDPRTATEAERQIAFHAVVAHETAHQWFGDLVTMSWWDDLWLNEGFANWMEYKVTDHFHPEWKIWLKGHQDTEMAMATDAKAGTHPIIQHIHDVLQADNAFDEITYDKGASVIRMLEAYVGEDAWRAGVRRYIAAHAYGNAVTDDLWREIDAGSPRKITDIAHDFTKQTGIPLIRVSATPGGVQLAPGQFTLDDTSSEKPSWLTPVYVGLADAPQAGRYVLVGKGSGAQPYEAPGQPAGSVYIANLGQAGYFRSLYLGQAANTLKQAYANLSTADQLGVLDDTAAEALAGYAPMAQFLDLADQAPPDADPLVSDALVQDLIALDRLYDGSPEQARFRAFALSRLRPIFLRLGWAAKAGDPPNAQALRTDLLIALGQFGDADIVIEARRRFARLVAGGQLTPDEKRAVLHIVAVAADADVWDQLHVLAKTTTLESDKRDYYVLLATALDPILSDRALKLALSGEPAPTTAPQMIRAVAGAHPRQALAFVDVHWPEVSSLLDPAARSSFASFLVSKSADRGVALALEQFAIAHVPATGRSTFTKAQATIAANAHIKETRLPEVDSWLAQHHN
jgi:aminopeptidase N